LPLCQEQLLLLVPTEGFDAREETLLLEVQECQVVVNRRKYFLDRGLEQKFDG
jgi:hypothetical protein